MALKGTTKIQLFDAKTGELTDEIVEENLVTNAVANILNPSIKMLMGETANQYGEHTTRLVEFLKRCSPIGKQLFGGVMLFSQALDENVDYIIPTPRDRDNIVGYAGQYSGTTGNLFKGSYNTAESVELPNGFTHVWEFSSEQANGDIAAVALTSAMGGDCGWNTPYHAENKGNFLIPITNLDFTAESKRFDNGNMGYNYSTALIFSNATFQDTSKRNCAAVVTNGDYVALFGLSTESDVVTVHWNVSDFGNKVDLNRVLTNNLFESEHALVSQGSWTGDGVIAEFKKSNIRAYIIGNTYRIYHSSNPQFSYWGMKETETITCIDFVLNNDGTVTRKDPVAITLRRDDIVSVYNAKFETDKTGVEYDWNVERTAIDDNYIYMFGNTSGWGSEGYAEGYIFRVSKTNPSDITILETPNRVKVARVTPILGEFFVHISDYEAYRTRDFITYTRLDMGYHPNGITETPVGCVKEPYVCLENINNVAEFTTTARESRVMLVAPYLATINNLASLVTKTSSKTMKITYTIQNV